MAVCSDAAREIRRYLRNKTKTALNVRRAGPHGDWIDIRGTGPAHTFSHEEMPVISSFLETLGLRISPARDFATLSPRHVHRALEIIQSQRSESPSPCCDAPVEVTDGVSETPYR